MKKPMLLLALMTVLAAPAAHATCPQLTGKYAFHCTVNKDGDEEFAKVLEASGQMAVDQTGCDAYRFTELTELAPSEVIDLNKVDPDHKEIRVAIRKSKEIKLKFKTVSYIDKDASDYDLFWTNLLGKRFVAKMKIKTTKDGFALKGIEKTRTLGIFGKRHSKFECRFDHI